MNNSENNKFPWLKYLIAFLAIPALSILPLVIVIGTGVFANVYGCEIDEQIIYSCTVFGVDWGFAVHFAGALLWYAVSPFLFFGLVGYAIWLISLLFEFVIFHLRKRSSRKVAKIVK